MKRASIKAAILIPSLAVLIAGIVAMAVVVGTLSSSAASDLTTQLIEARVSEYNYAFNELCGEINGAVTATTPIISNYIDPEFALDVTNPRGEVTDILSKVLMSNEDIVSMWTCWESDAFDGKDSEYANTSFYDATGRFIPYVYHNGSGFIVEALVDYNDPAAGEYYQGARNTGKPYITDPYNYNFGGNEILICSLAVPILQNGKVVGVVGADINLEKFITKMNNATILDDGYLFTLSPSGLFASHSNSDLHMSSYNTTWMKDYKEQVEKVLSNGGSFSVHAYSDVIDSNVVFLGTGVMVGNTGRYWLICGVVPESTEKASSTSLLCAIIGIGFVLILVVGATVFYVVNLRLKELPKLTATAEALTEGDIGLAESDTGTESTRNEITLLDRAFSKMTAGIREQSSVLSRISQGDYTITIPIRSEKDVMNQAINDMLDSTNRTLSQISSTSSQVFAGSKQIADGSQFLAHGATEQASAVEELSVSVNEIANKTGQNADIAKKAAALSNTIKESAEKGSRQMDQMLEAVKEIQDASNSISKVIKVIDDIAFQTNILALNAAVEAARAGQHGKGFAVVAEEVRNLAAKSANAAKDTENLIANSMEKAELGARIAGETAVSLADIVVGINENGRIMEDIAKSSEEQAAAVGQINTGIEQVAHVVQQNSATAQESASASEEMSEQANALEGLVTRFKIRDMDNRK